MVKAGMKHVDVSKQLSVSASVRNMAVFHRAGYPFNAELVAVWRRH